MYDKMSVLQQVLTDARKLANRLREHDSSAESLLSSAQGMFKQVEGMKEYSEEMNKLNEAANNRPRSALIHSIQQENRHIRELQQENKELRLALEEHQNVMELIMSKYRQQVAKLVTVNANTTPQSTTNNNQMAGQIERVNEMVAVMRKASQMGDEEAQDCQKLITALATENKGLREMLHIATRAGSIPSAQRVDIETQTDMAHSYSDATIRPKKQVEIQQLPDGGTSVKNELVNEQTDQEQQQQQVLPQETDDDVNYAHEEANIKEDLESHDIDEDIHTEEVLQGQQGSGGYTTSESESEESEVNSQPSSPVKFEETINS